MADEREDIRSRIDIVALVGRELPLKQKGKHWTGLCPFHPDKNPSFFVSQETGRFRCWSCQAAGDIFDWVMRRQNVDFGEALQILAKEAGITLKRGGGLTTSARNQFESAMDVALTFFQEQLRGAASAQEYCARRGLDAPTIARWKLGYAPDVGEALPVKLKKAGIPLSEAKALFLVDEDAGGGYFAKFRRRLMFPIHDEKGVLVAFGGRLLGDGHPKYINSSDTPLYRKSRVLYGMNFAREAISRERRAVLVEGYLDVIACHRAGVETAVASLGTSLTEDHAKLLKRWCDEVVVLYDSDGAGQKAAARAIEVLQPEGLRVRIAMMPEGQDPDTLLRDAGPGGVRDAVTASLSPTDYRIRTLEARLNPSEEAYWGEVAAILAQEPSELEVVRHLDRLAGVYPATRDLQLAKGAIRGSIVRARRETRDRSTDPDAPAPRYKAGPRAAQPGIPRELKSAEIVVLLAFLGEEFRRDGWRLVCATDLFESGLARRVSEAVRSAFPEPPQGRAAQWLAQIEDEELETLLSDLMFDSRGERLSEEYISGAARRLREACDVRRLRDFMKSGGALGEIDRRLREMKPDSLVPAMEPTEDS